MILLNPSRVSQGHCPHETLTIYTRCDTVDSRFEAANEESWLGLEAIPSVFGRSGL